jgi:hypothetical protein
MFSDRGFEISETDGLQAHVGVVKVPNGRLDKKNFHRSKVLFSIELNSNIARAVGASSIEQCHSLSGAEHRSRHHHAIAVCLPRRDFARHGSHGPPTGKGITLTSVKVYPANRRFWQLASGGSIVLCIKRLCEEC